MTDKADQLYIGDVLISTDGLESMLSGMGDPTKDKAAATYYSAPILNDLMLQEGYRSGWIIPKLVDVPATDALRKWRDFSAEADQILALKNAENDLQVKKKVIRAYTLARLWGGAAIFINTGQDPSKPLNVDAVRKNGIKSLTVFNRKELTAEALVLDPFDENYGNPEFYTIANTTVTARIHYTHLVRFVGKEHPDPFNQIGPNQGWGDSVVQRIYKAARDADATSGNIASLVFEANIDVFSIPNFTAKMADQKYQTNMLKRFRLASQGKSIVNTLMHDADEKYERKQINFTNLPEVLQKFLLICAAAGDMPLTKFLGDQAKGMGDEGRGDMKNYYDALNTEQTLHIGPALKTLDECLIRHALGNRPPDISYQWRPFEQMNESQIAEIGERIAKTTEVLQRTGLYMPEVLEEATTNQLVQMGIMPGLDNLVAENKVDFNDFGLGDSGDDGDEEVEESATDAAPRPLYVRRDVKNAAAIKRWAKEQGFDDLVDDMHVTITYSREAVDWLKMGEQWQAELKIPEGGARVVEGLGNANAVLLFISSELNYRHKSMLRRGASWDFEDYTPHITLSYGQVPDLTKVKPYTGEIVLGPEIFEEVELSKSM